MTEKPEHTHALEGDVGVKAAVSVASALRQALKEHTSLCIDTHAVTQADLTTVQTLLAAKRMAESQGGRLVMTQPLAEPVLAALTSLGLLSGEPCELAFWSPNSEKM